MSAILDSIKASRASFLLRGINNQIVYNNIVKTKEFEKSISTLKHFHNIHYGKRCFIIATGPSLTLDDIEKIKNEYTFSVNSIIKSFDKTNWRPDYYCVSDKNVWESLREEIKTTNLKTVFFEGSYGGYQRENGVPIYHCSYPRFYEMAGIGKQKFSDDISKVIYAGSTVVYSVMQIAVYMGFKELYLLGTDCNYSIPGKQYSSLTNYNLKEPSASQKGKLNGSFRNNMFEDYYCAKHFAESHSVKIFNCTRGGMLEVFERVNLDTII